MTTIKDRLKEVAQYYNLSIRGFEEQCGLGRGNISNMSAEGSIGSDKLSKIIDAFPDVSLKWLISGSGSMIYTELQQPLTESQLKAVKGIPLVPIEAMAGLFQGEESVSLQECEFYDVPLFSEADYLIPIKGDSMYPYYSNGDVVACKKTSPTSVFFQWGKVYVVDTEQGVLIKRVYEGKSKNTIILSSDNKKYPAIEIPREEVYHIAIVLGTLRIE